MLFRSHAEYDNSRNDNDDYNDNIIDGIISKSRRNSIRYDC